MAEPIDLSSDEIIKFLKNKGGRATNLELVTYFRKLLNDPQNQVEMRLRFKDIINTVANVCEEQGTKYISLKQKYLDPVPTSDQRSPPNENCSQPYQPYWRYRLSSNAKMVPPPPILSFQSPNPEQRSESFKPSPDVSVSEQSPKSIRRQCDKRRAGIFDDVLLDQLSQETLSENSNSQSLSDFNSEFGSCNAIGLPLVNRRHSTISLSCVERTNSRNNSDYLPNYRTPCSNWNGNNHNNAINVQRRSSSYSSYLLDNRGSPQALPDMKPVNYLPVEEDDASTADEYKVHSGSVKERAQQIEMMAAMVDTSRKVPSHTSYKHLRTKENRIEKSSDDDTSVVSTLDPKLRRQWLVKSAQCDYHGLSALLKAEPRLAGLRDMTSGFTALHWASKHGNADVVKLIAGAYRVSPDIKSHGGYTCIHLATLYKHKSIVDLLIKTYGANPTIRDNSGRRADQYPTNYLTTAASATRQAPFNRNYSKDTQSNGPSPTKRRKTFRISLKTRKMLLS